MSLRTRAIPVVALLGALLSVPEPSRAAELDVVFTSTATPIPSNPAFPRATAPYGSVVTFSIGGSGPIAYEEFGLSVSCPNTSLIPGSISPEPDTVSTAQNTTQVTWIFPEAGSGGGTFSVLVGVVGGNLVVPCTASAAGTIVNPHTVDTGTAYLTVELTTDQPPTAAFTATRAAGDHMKFGFDASASTATGGATIASYTWDFDDGKVGTGEKVNHTFATPGSYIVELTVTDSNGLEAVTTHLVTASANANVAAVEVTQSIQEYQLLDALKASLQANGGPPVPLVSGKPAVLRLYFDEVTKATPATVTVTGALSKTKTIALQPGCFPEMARGHVDDCPSLDFYFTPPSGSWQLGFTVTDSAENVLQQETLNFTSRDTNAMRMLGVSVCDGTRADAMRCADPSALLGKTELIRKMMPTSAVTTEITSDVVRRVYVADPNFPNGTDALIDDFLVPTVRVLDRLFTLPDADDDFERQRRTTFVGVYRRALGQTGQAHLAPTSHALMIPDLARRLNRDATDEVVTHETGHTLGLKHTNLEVPEPYDHDRPGCYNSALDDTTTDWPFGTNYVQSASGLEYPFDVEAKEVLNPRETFDIMSYCGPRWISPQHYRTALDTLEILAAPLTATLRTQAVVATADFWEVGGTMPPSGLVFDPLFTVTTQAESDAGEGTHTIEVQNGGGGALFTRHFTPTVATTDTLGDDVQGDPVFAELVPVTAGAAKIVVKDPNGGVLGTLVLGGTPPTVGITSPTAGFIGTGVKPVDWTITDPDSPSTTSRVLYSADAGAHWSELGQLADITSLPVDFDLLPGTTGATALIRVLVSDGVNTGAATSAAFTVAKKNPTAVVIESPQPGFAQAAADPIQLVGAAHDPDDGALTGAQLQWSSNLQGVLGIGSPLSLQLQPGAHTLTLTATDSDGHAVQATTSVVIGGNPPALAITTAPATYGCTTMTVSAVPGSNGGAPLTTVQYTLDGGVTYATIPLGALPFGFVVPGTGPRTVTARAYDASQQSSARSAVVDDNPYWCALHGPVCIGGTTISKAKLTLKKLGAPLGDEALSVSGVLDFGPGTPATFNPPANGAQLLVEDLGVGAASVFDLTHFTLAIPPGAVGTHCGKKDGWKKLAYANKSGALNPPTCTPGSGNGLGTLKLKDTRAKLSKGKSKGVPFSATAKASRIPDVVGPLRITLVTSGSGAAGESGECGVYAFNAASCKRKKGTLTCKTPK